MRLLKSKRRLYLLGIDFLTALFVFLMVGAVMFFAGETQHAIDHYVARFAVFAVVLFASRIILRVYSNVWRYANSKAYVMIMLSDFITGVLLTMAALLPFSFITSSDVWLAIALVSLTDIATLLSRFVYQIYYRNEHRERARGAGGKIGVAIVGAGQIGALLAEELTYNVTSKYVPVCFIDKDKNKVGSRIAGLQVYNEDERIIEVLKALSVEEIFIALPSISGEQAASLLEYYGRSGCPVKLYDFPIRDSSEKGGKRVIREFKIEDLLFRDSIQVFDGATRDYYSGKVVLVTGGGGSIGSELCRQIAKCEPKKLVIFDIYENNAYDIQQELKLKYGSSLDLSVEIGSVRDRARLNAVFAAYRPEIVLHAAAHKHVPLMEHSNSEAIKNNVLGTYNTADMAEKHGTEKFILISTDKAVNPTNVMGASKRMCEMVIQCRTDSRTSFAAVRFGNVLGSNGSVIPLFKRQIESGGPITITDKRIIRYFMTIPEASGLVMQAGAMAKGGDLFVLDMGKPVKILDLAENMIKLSGLIPYEDIDIVETGLRPGEKLYEELLIKTENLTKTENDLIFIERDTPYTRAEIEEKLKLLTDAVKLAEDTIAAESIKLAMKAAVPTFLDPDEVNRTAASTREMKLTAPR